MTLIFKRSVILTLIAFFVVQKTLAPASAADPPKEPVPLIVIDGVPLIDAIRNLARQTESNFILDPRIGATLQEKVSLRETNTTAFATLTNLLKRHKLVWITNAATTIARIAPATLGAQPVSASQVGAGKGTVIPVMALDEVPLSEAITKIAEAALLQVTVDPVWPDFTDRGRIPVTFRWEKVSARQALAALLDDYDLILIEGPAGGQSRVVAHTRPAAPARLNVIP